MPIMLLLFGALAASFSYAFLLGDDVVRSVIRSAYYAGLFALMSFCFEMGRRPDSYQIFIKGLVVTGALLALYGIYQLIAIYTGLPLRGILRGASGVDMAFEAGIVRINSLANEPKRLGYVLFVSGLAALSLATQARNGKLLIKGLGFGVIAVSLLTLSGSYFLAIFLFACAALLLYPSKFSGYFFGLLAVGAIVITTVPDLGLYDAIQSGYERRVQEVEVGLDGVRVYRQEFFA